MRALLLLLIVGAGVHFGRQFLEPQTAPWPAYAAPEASCGADLSVSYDGKGLKFKHPADWKVTERSDPASGVFQAYLAPKDGAVGEVVLFLREMGGGGIGKLAAKTGVVEPEMPGRESKGPSSSAVAGTKRTITLQGGRQAYAYLTKTSHPERGEAHSWMSFLWDGQARMAAISGPSLKGGWWPPVKERSSRLNCVFWEVLKTVEPK